ncbi:MAG: TolC family protein, partial [Burkholderiales bacterium]
MPPTLAAQRLDYGAEVAPHWWEQFGSSDLDRLVERALKKNPGLESAQHTLEQARYEFEAARGIFSPQVSLGAGVARERSSGATSGGLARPIVYGLYTGQIDVSYYPDVFGLNRLVAQNAQAQVDVAHERLRAARLVLE